MRWPAGVFFLGLVSVGIGFVTLLPINQGAFVNDGKRILKLLRPGVYADAYAAVMALGAYALAQVPPGDRDPDLVTQAASLGDGSHEDLAGRLAAHSDALHRGDVEAAEEHIRYLLDLRDAAYPPYRPVIDLAAAYFEAAYAGDAASARRRLEGAGKSALLAFDPTARIQSRGRLAPGRRRRGRSLREVPRGVRAPLRANGTGATRLRWPRFAGCV